MMESLFTQNGAPLGKKALARLRLKALRSGVWFKKLKISERTLMELVIRIVDKVRSRVLAKVLSQIVNELLEAMEGEVSRLMRTVGRPLAQKLSEVAQGWGNKSANRWVEDPGFIQYLAVMHKNLSSMLKV